MLCLLLLWYKPMEQQTIDFVNTDRPYAITINDDLKGELLGLFKEKTQTYRIVDYLSSHCLVRGGDLSHETYIANLSEIARQANRVLLPSNIHVGCEAPLDANGNVVHLKNKMGMTATQLWSLYDSGVSTANRRVAKAPNKTLPESIVGVSA